MAKYTGDFASINEKLYRVEIITNNSISTTKELKLSNNPFVTEMNDGGDTIYTPIKGSAATIEIIVEDYLFDLYSESPTGSKVTLYNVSEGNNIEWTGYITPQMFDQSFSAGLTNVSLDAVDCLSVLESLKYESVSKDVLSFENIIRKILSKVNVRYMYVSNNIQINNYNGTETVLDKLFISEMNFFDSKKDTETDDDVCWTCKDVISEICQYLGYVATMIGPDLYLMDYDSIRKSTPQYWRYDLKTTSNPTLQTIQHTHKIDGNDHYENSATVSLDAIYNKISVLAETYTFDELVNVSDYGDENITNLDNSNLSSSLGAQTPKTPLWAEVFPADDDQSKAMDVFIDVHNDKNNHGGGDKTFYDFCAIKFIKKYNSKFFIYNDQWENITSQFENYKMSYPVLQGYNGACYVKYFTKNIDKVKNPKDSYVKQQWLQYYKDARLDPNLDSSKYLDYCLDRGGIHNISWTEAIIMKNRIAHTRQPESEWYKYPYYETECEGSIIQGGENSAMIIQGNFYWHMLAGDVYPMEYNDFKLDKPNWINPNVDMFVPASIQWGNLWWNGKDWQNTKCGFKLNWLATEYRDDNQTKDKSVNIEQWKCQKTVMQPQPITNTVQWRFGTTEEGCLIKVPTSGENLVGKPKLTIYRPVSGRTWKSRKDYINGDDNAKLGDNNSGIRWPWYFVALIGLKFKSLMGDPSYSDANDTDTIYTNILENDSIEDLGEISFKVHTFDNKQNSYGSVGLSGGSMFVDKTYNKALYNEERTWYESNNVLATNGMRQEEHLIYKLVNQYTKPSKILDCKLKNGVVKPYGLYTDTTLSDSYIVSTISTDYKMENQNVKLIQKK